MHRPVVTHLTLALVAGLFVAGCSPSDDDVIGAAWVSAAMTPDTTDDGDVERFALLTATVAHPRSRGGLRADPVSLRAVFVSHAGQAREAVLDLLSLPQLLRLEQTDTCSLVARETTSWSGGDAFRPEGDAGWVDLLDAGQVSVGVASARQTLDPQYFPDVVATVSGVTYAGSAGLGPLPLRRRGSSEVRFDGTGSGEVGSFAVSLALPAAVRLRLVGGRLPVDGHARVERTGGLAVRWDTRGTSDEPLMLELSRRSFGAVDTIRCIVEDDGAFTVPAALRGRLPEHPEPATDRLTVRRATGVEFYARGVDEGWAFAISEDFVLLDLAD